ncbi:MAG TPA: kelch repeat-containing protein [Polyangia bacterium]|jgi:hypothetical protein|nr:kelch repeat-containing protein [Polyangia bacterium]
MTTTNLLRVGATVLFFTAACKSDFAAGITDNGDASAQEAGAQQDGRNPNAQEAGPQTSSDSASCDPFQPPTKSITLTNVLGIGRDTDGTLYVVDQPQAGGERVFVLSGTTLQRQRIAGSGTETAGGGVMLYSFTITDHTPPFMLKLETDASGPTAMGVLQEPPPDIRTFTIGQQGSVLTLVPASQVAALPVADIPAETFIEYNATLPDGRALLVVRPRDDWTYQDFRVFFGAPGHMAERSVSQVVRYKDGGSTTINFTIDGVAAIASFPVQLSPGGLVIGPATLTIGAASFPLTLGPTASPPSGDSYFCLGNPSPDGGVDAWVPPADGPSVCRAPSPDYGPTSVFSFLPSGTPQAAVACPAACGDSAWPTPQAIPNIDTALPYGSCTPGTPSCSTAARVPCACGGATGPIHGFICSCEGGNWTCGIRTAGAAICMPCPDAGVGGLDAGSALKGIFASTGSMTVARMGHTATLLPSGKVLVAGGVYNAFFAGLASAELYDPLAGTFTATGNMTVARGTEHTATLLATGRVLIAGGQDDTNDLASAELYDPAAGTFTATGSMSVGRAYPTATLLVNGKVLIAGGAGSSAELYDPATGIFTATGMMTAARTEQTATLLTSGKVLIAGGWDYVSLASAELYDPTAGTFTATGSMTAARYFHTATRLPSGRVLIAGGYDSGYLESAELYDPTAGTFTTVGSMTAGRVSHTATLLGNGNVLIAGGDVSDRASAELYDSSTGTFSAITDMLAPRADPTAALLGSGKVLITGGMSITGDAWVDLASAELYQ